MVTSYMTMHIMVRFNQNLEKIQYDTALAITRAMSRISKENRARIKISQKKFCCFHKNFNKQSPKYHLNIISVCRRLYFTRYVENVPSFKARHHFLKKICLFLL